MRGNALFQLQPLTKDNNDAARAAFEQALKIDPNDVDALTGDAVAYLHEKQYGMDKPRDRLRGENPWSGRAGDRTRSQ